MLTCLVVSVLKVISTPMVIDTAVISETCGRTDVIIPKYL